MPPPRRIPSSTPSSRSSVSPNSLPSHRWNTSGFQGEYLKYLNAAHITPLDIVQPLLPLMRNSPSRPHDAINNGVNSKGKETIFVCVPALDTCIGLHFLGPSPMSVVATLHAVDVLRPEVRVAASIGGAEGRNDIEVVSLEVGALDIPPLAG